VSVIKTTADVRVSILRSLKDLAIPVALAFLLAAGASYALSSYLTAVISDLARRAERIAAGEQGVRLETWSQSELGGLARAFERMRVKLEGKRYVEDMAATLSHELKTPLTSIRGAAEILESDPDPPTQARFLANIRSDVDRMAAIIENLLALARAETLPVDPDPRCKAEPVFHDLVAAARRRAEPAGVIVESTSAAAPTFRIPAEHFRRIGDVLAENAIAFTPPGGRVAFTLDASGLTIADTGSGIPEAVRGKVFDRFFTTVNPLTGRRGTGLGLALAQSLARKYHARITLQPASPTGTIARVDFIPQGHPQPRTSGADPVTDAAGT
jgi:signal transduction histidine kinase